MQYQEDFISQKIVLEQFVISPNVLLLIVIGLKVISFAIKSFFVSSNGMEKGMKSNREEE